MSLFSTVIYTICSLVIILILEYLSNGISHDICESFVEIEWYVYPCYDGFF